MEKNNEAYLNETPMSMLSSIPTISGSIADQFAMDAFDLVANVPELTTKQIVQQKFKDNEHVDMIFEAYQMVGQEYTVRLLALVVSYVGGTYAVFALTPTHLSNLYDGDLKIGKIFPINENFRISTETKGSISQLQFDIKCAIDEPAEKYYYYPNRTATEAVSFAEFYSRLIFVQQSGAPGIDSDVLSYGWLNDYRQIGEVMQEVKRREKEYIVYKDLLIYCGTWNVNNNINDESSLHLWLKKSEKPPDIYAIALQELGHPNLAISLREIQPDPFWIDKMLKNVHHGDKYEHLISVRLVGIMLTILIKTKLKPRIARCRIKSLPRGILNTLGNKGGVAVSLQLNEGNICFVNSHLAAHTAHVETRNLDYAGINKGIIFDDDLKRTINDHDHIFWLGDLNYRIEDQNIQGGLKSPYEYKTLERYDQLYNEMRKGKCFDGYKEGPITFNPTYKYKVGTDDFDISEKQRAPSYCDRILWKGSCIEQLSYNSVMEVRESDHKPVYATFNVKVKTKDEKAYKRVHEDVLKMVDKHENENQPHITVDSTVLNFGLVHFNEMVYKDLVVSNSCAMAVEFMFKEKDPILHKICEKWLQVKEGVSTLFPGSSKHVRVKLSVDASSVRDLLQKIRTTNWKFDFDILILHVKNGSDIFLTVTGEYKPSCFGLSVETLCRTNRPISEYTQAEVKDLMNDNSPEYAATMPREFFFLIDFLHQQGKRVMAAFSSSYYTHAKDEQFNQIRDWLDNWSSNNFPGTPQYAASALLMLLDLPEKPLLDPFVEDLLETDNAAEAMKYILLLSTPKRNVFVHLCMFFREGIERKYYDIISVASIIGPILLRIGNNPVTEGRKLRCMDFMMRFLNSDLSTLSNSSNIGTTNIDRGAVGDGKEGLSNILDTT